jgi:hypothetical protein
MSTQETEASYQHSLGDEALAEAKEVEQEEEYESTGSESEPSQKRQKTSKIWEGFMILESKSNGESAKCSTCYKTISTLLTSINSIGQPKTDADYDAARRAFVMLIITSGLSLSIIEGPSFKRLMSAVNPLFPCSRSIIYRDIMALYGREINSLQVIMSEAPGRISFAIDRWKGKETGENYDDVYICISACFIDADWKLQRRIMGFRYLDYPEDVIYVSDIVKSCFTEMEVDQKVMCITLDNALDDASVANSLKTILVQNGKLLCDGELYRMHCCTDILNSVVKAGLELIDDVVDKIRHGIHYITYSRKRENEFYRYAKESCLFLDDTMKLRADLVVNWDSTYKMLACALYYKEALKHFASKHRTFLSNFHLGDEEWNRVATMQKFIKPLYGITWTFLSMKHKTANSYFVGLCKVYRLLQVTNEQENFMGAMVKDMKSKFEKYWSEYSLVLACAAVLDPRYKLNLVSYCFKKIYGDVDASQYTDKVVALLHRLSTEYEKLSSLAAVGSGIIEYQARVDLSDNHTPPEQKTELDWYLESPAMDLNVDFDILEFWSGMSKCYPNLANLARDILAIPISTVPSKSVFTMGEKIVSPRRCTLEPDLLEMLISLHDWTCPKDKRGTTFSLNFFFCFFLICVYIS